MYIQDTLCPFFLLLHFSALSLIHISFRATAMEAKPKVSDVFEEYKLRRSAIVNALTTESDKFYQMCDPEKANLCLYGHSNGTWEVKEPDELVPTELPEPTVGINFARDGIGHKEWLFLVAIHSGCWLLAVTFFSYNDKFDKNDRERLFDLINELPTVFEVVSKEFTTTNPQPFPTKSKKARCKSGQSSAAKKPKVEKAREEKGDVEKDEQDRNLCAACGIDYKDGEFWILCDVCGKWYHGKCVSVAPEIAKNIGEYMCPTCSALVSEFGS